MKRPRLAAVATVLSLSFGTAAALGPRLLPEVFGQETFPSASNKEDEPVIRGTVKSFLKNDHDDVDGLQLDGGLEVHFPPHVGREVVKLVEVGEEVRVEIEKKVRRDGDVVMEARRIEHDGQTIKVEPPPKGAPKSKPAKGRPQNEPPMNVDGTVKEFATNPKGDVDGFVLEDGTVVKFPPHLGRELKALVATGEKVRVEGRRHETPKGDVHLHADRIESVASGRSLDRPEPPKGKPAPHHPEREAEGALQARVNEDILRELRAIRAILEDRKP